MNDTADTAKANHIIDTPSGRASCAILVFWAMAACGGGASTSANPSTALENQSEAPAGARAAQSDSDNDVAVAAEATLAGPNLVIPDSAQPAPDGLLMTLILPNPNRDFSALGGYVDVVQPGMGGVFSNSGLTLMANVLDMPGLNTLDPDKPVRALFLDPRAVSRPWLLVGHVRDATKLADLRAGDAELMVFEHHDFVALGTREALEQAAPYALSTLVEQALPPNPLLSVRTGALLTRFEVEIQSVLGLLEMQAGSNPDMAGVLAMMRALIGVTLESDRLDFSLAIQGAAAELRFEFVPSANTTFAALVSAEPKSDFSMVSLLPESSMVLAGHSLSPALREAIEKVSQQSRMPGMSPAQREKLDRASSAFRASVNGEFGVSIDISHSDGFWMAGLWQTSDDKVAHKAMNDIWGAMGDMMKLTMPTLKYKKKSFKHRKARLAELTLSWPKDLMGPMQSEIEKFIGKGGLAIVTGGAPDHLLMTAGKNARARSKDLVDTLASKRPTRVEPALTGVLEDARRRGESAVMAVDVDSLLANLGIGQAPSGGGDWTVMGVSFANQSVLCRSTVPAGALRSIMKAITHTP